MLIRGFAIETIRRVGTCVIGVAVLWQVAERASLSDGEVVVHVTEPGVVVLIDDDAYPFDPSPGSPLVCPLRSGTHTMTVTRGGRTIQDETFHLDPGGHAVLTARDATRPNLPSRRLGSPSERW